jgi:hypothetical protein
MVGAVSKSTTFMLTLRTQETGAHRRLRRALKTLLRRDQLEAIDVREICDQTSPDEPVQTPAVLTDRARR